jgi:hypothetical protein
MGMQIDGWLYCAAYERIHDEVTLLLDEQMALNEENVRELINYLQNWVDTGDFEGKKEAESND